MHSDSHMQNLTGPLTVPRASSGAIYIRRRPRVRLEALINGGGQERGIRSGTLPAPLAVGLGAAARIARQELDSDHRWGERSALFKPTMAELAAMP